MSNYTIIGGDGKQYGPISETDLRKWFNEGRLNGHTMVKSESDAEFRPFSAFPEFSDLFQQQSAEAPQGFPDSQTLIAGDYDLDIGNCISRGWDLIKNNFWSTVGVTTLVMIVISAVNQLFALVERPFMDQMMRQHIFTPTAILVVVFLTIISTPIYAIFTAGLFKYYLKLIRGETAQIGDAFSGFGPSIGQLTLFGLVQMFLVLLGIALCVIPGIYLSVCWYFAIPLIIDRQMGFWEAMELSRKMVTKHWFMVFAFLVVYAILAMVGIIACCVGIFVTLSIGFAALMYAYETIFSGRQAN